MYLQPAIQNTVTLDISLQCSGESQSECLEELRMDEQIATTHEMQRRGATKAAMSRTTGLSRPTVYAILDGS